ncbi:tRNA threonylcarbamoyladenosine biosynthesis protein TsaB [Botrimarina colliarenosi]|uniref:tRNA threonylcarbamoyladenosine biosynthesis protein TsaB n=1 Tax=Botrimarina colliarenosi TaxID=2528001 RepID=A0A5C6A5I1_9BACT|nr:tRNA (adenosine(37)-N6)-threonylcarbamoyltransferase complex dimerization subunit type 1 TsaB [Botrimarina colliarenosi]TWT95204.1 tRNA threonylcarbamoyladenosine biosynthesis protein TsaB [Botrimarina colliarenosi]
MPNATPDAPNPAPQPAQAGKWLAIETSGLFGSVAAGQVDRNGCEIVAAETLPRDARSARTLAPTIQRLLGRLGWAPGDLTTVAVAVGPGSFTGLRVGVTTAKAFAWGIGAAVLAVDTLDALAAAATPPDASDSRLTTVVDAQRSELFVARFSAGGGEWRRETPTSRTTAAALQAELGPADRVVGPAAATVGGDPSEPQADAVLRVAWRRWLAGEADSVLALVPQYYRASAAEEKLATQ